MARALEAHLMASYDELLAASRLPRTESRQLIETVCQRSREWLIAHGDQSPNDEQLAQFTALCRRRLAGEPLAYLVGHREFYGRDFRLSTHTLIPRSDTELLVDWALERAPKNARVLDLGTGSGAIAVSIACERGDLHVSASDISEHARRQAQDNAERLGAIIECHTGDWWQALPSGAMFDLIVSNPPYIRANDPHLRLGDLRYEPETALISGSDGLTAIRTIIMGCSAHLRDGGLIAIEHGYDQADDVRKLLTAAGMHDGFSRQDGAGHWRISGASK